MAWKGQPDGVVVAGPAEEKDDCDGAKVVVAAPDGDHFTVE